MIDNDTYDVLNKLAGSVELIRFKKGRKGYHLPSINELEALIDGNDKIRFDLFGTGRFWGIDEHERIAPYLVGADLDTDCFEDSEGVSKYANLQQLTLCCSGGNIDEDNIHNMHFSLCRLKKLKKLDLQLLYDEDDVAQNIIDIIKFPSSGVEVRITRLSGSGQSLKGHKRRI